jgi:cytochrome c biogenesis protein ResB
MAGVVVMKIANAVWTFFGSATLSVWALLGLVVVLCCGYYLFEAAPTLYEPLNRLLLWDWIKSYGWHNLTNTWWFLSFLVLLGLLVANTFVCTWQKVAVLAKRGAKGSRLDFVLRFSPHVMHAAFIIILASHLVHLRVRPERAEQPGAVRQGDHNPRLGDKAQAGQHQVGFFHGR